MDASEVGKYGTLSLMKRLEPDKAVANYPIDDEEISFGRDPSCSIRLYYDSVSSLHAKIIFQDRKAYLVVLGTNGLLVDGCPVFPNPSTASGAAPVTVPLPNNSSIEIHKKRFVFTYPPKELRAALLATPSKELSSDQMSTPDMHRRRRTLRMSMIQSAQVFTPRPGSNPKENLRILRTPIKSPFKAEQTPRSYKKRRESSPLKRGMYIAEESDEDEEEEQKQDEEIVLVEGTHPRVYEEDRDLVILEHVTVREPTAEAEATPTHGQRHRTPSSSRTPGRGATPRQRTPLPAAFPLTRASGSPRTPQAQTQTPAKRRRPSLHKAVLLRSALRREMEVEEREEQEADEVEDSIIADGDEPEDGGEEGDVEMDEHDEVDHEHEYEDDEHDDEGHAQFSQRSPQRRVLGNFMTPQPQHRTRHRLSPFATAIKLSPTAAARRQHVRYSVGGFTPGGITGLHSGRGADPMTGATPLVAQGRAEGLPRGPRRVRLVEAWKIEDLVVPVKEDDEDQEDAEDHVRKTNTSMEDNEGAEDEKEEAFWGAEGAEREDHEEPLAAMTPGRAKREKLSEEEKQAILFRRRSALHAPDAFFGAPGQAPGSRRLSLFPLSPAKPKTNPTALPAFASMPALKAPAAASAPTPAKPVPTSISESTIKNEVKNEEDTTTEGEDAAVLLARMRHMVEGAKRRQSMGTGLGGNAGPSGGDRRASINPFLDDAPGPGARRQSVRDPGEFSLLAPDAHQVWDPVRPVAVAGGDEEEEEEEEDGEEDNVGGQGEQVPAHDDAEESESDKENLAEDVVEDAQAHADDDVEMANGEAPANGNAAEIVPSSTRTPQLGAHASARPMQTPRFDGMRELFRPEKVMATPAYEGLGEMMATPEGYKEAEVIDVDAEADEVQHEEEPEVDAEDEEQEHLGGESQEEHEEHDPVDDGHVAEETEDHDHQEYETEEEPAEKPAPKARATARATRGRKAATPTLAVRTPAPRRAKSREPPAPADAEDTAEFSVAARVTRKPRLRSASADPEPADAAPKGVRRTRKAVAPEEPSEEAHTLPKRRTRRTPTPEVTQPSSVPAPARRGAKPGARAGSADPTAGSSTGKTVSRAARSKVAMVVTIKEEDEEAESSAPAARTTAASRARRQVGTHIPRGTVRGTMRSVGTASTRKATKENTPEPSEEHHAGDAAVHTTKSAIPRVGTKAGRSAATREEHAITTKARMTRVRAAKK